MTTGTKNITLTQARNHLLRLAKELERHPQTVVEVVKHGRPVMTLISASLYDSLVETLEALEEGKTLTRLRRALKEIARGKGLSWEKAKRKLGIRG